LGIPLFKLAAEMTGGYFSIESRVGEGTVVKAGFFTGHIDSPPEGDMAGTVVTLIQGSPGTEFIYRRKNARGEFVLDTREIKKELEGIPINEPEILLWIKQYIQENSNLPR
jgi:hypothetical protein